MRERKSLVEQMEDRADDSHSDDQPKERPVNLFLPTGCSLCNCSLSDRVNGGWPCGRMSQVYGMSDLGKSALTTIALAEAAQIPAFDSYRLQDWDIEHARTKHSMFGQRYRDRVEHWHTGSELYPVPTTVEEAQMRIIKLFKEGTPFVINLDSLDFLPSKQALKETEESFMNWEKINKSEKPDKESGSYNMAKQKHLKRMLGEFMGKIGQTESVILLVSQVIANADAINKYSPKTTYAGGYGVKFGTRIRVKLSATGKVDVVRDQVVGREVNFIVEKNHITFKKRDVKFWLYEGLGVDDIRTTVEFLIDQKHWKNKDGSVTAPEFPMNLIDSKGKPKLPSVRELVRHIDRSKGKDMLDRILQRVWNQRESEIEKFIFEERTSPYI